jgi:hypothetical protein
MEDLEIKLVLKLSEVSDIVKVLGELPTRSNAWPLLQKIDGQVQPQLPEDAPAE